MAPKKHPDDRGQMTDTGNGWNDGSNEGGAILGRVCGVCERKLTRLEDGNNPPGQIRVGSWVLVETERVHERGSGQLRVRTIRQNRPSQPNTRYSQFHQ